LTLDNTDELYEWRVKSRYDTVPLEADFISRLPDGTVLATCTIGVETFYGNDPFPTDIISGPVTVRKTQAKQLVIGGQEGQVYRVTFDAVSDDGDEVTLYTMLTISTPPDAGLTSYL